MVTEPTEKRCSKCGKAKPYSAFWKSQRTRDGRQTYCKVCSQETTKARRLGRSEADRLRDRVKRKCWTYNISESDLSDLMNAQGGLCICGKSLDWSDLNIDHDHKCCPERSCGKCVRGILCTNCNVALGMIKDNPNHALALATYLLRFEDVLHIASIKGE